MNLPRSSYYRGDQPHRAQARAAFRAAVEAVCLGWPSYGYRRVTQELRRQGWQVNHKRVSRLMREEALTARTPNAHMPHRSISQSLPVPTEGFTPDRRPKLTPNRGRSCISETAEAPELPRPDEGSPVHRGLPSGRSGARSFLLDCDSLDRGRQSAHCGKLCQVRAVHGETQDPASRRIICVQKGTVRR